VRCWVIKFGPLIADRPSAASGPRSIRCGRPPLRPPDGKGGEGLPRVRPG
jgi:hypothetical protein